MEGPFHTRYVKRSGRRGRGDGRLFPHPGNREPKTGKSSKGGWTCRNLRVLEEHREPTEVFSVNIGVTSVRRQRWTKGVGIGVSGARRDRSGQGPSTDVLIDPRPNFGTTNVETRFEKIPTTDLPRPVSGDPLPLHGQKWYTQIPRPLVIEPHFGHSDTVPLLEREVSLRGGPVTLIGVV